MRRPPGRSSRVVIQLTGRHCCCHTFDDGRRALHPVKQGGAHWLERAARRKCGGSSSAQLPSHSVYIRCKNKYKQSAAVAAVPGEVLALELTSKERKRKKLLKRSARTIDPMHIISISPCTALRSGALNKYYCKSQSKVAQVLHAAHVMAIREI